MKSKQESIPVGCVPPAFVVLWGHTHPLISYSLDILPLQPKGLGGRDTLTPRRNMGTLPSRRNMGPEVPSPQRNMEPEIP